MSEQNIKPTIGITMGDPAGIGAQIIAKALQNTALSERARFVIYGANASLTFAADTCNLQTRWDRVDAKSERATKNIQSSIVVLDDSEDGVSNLQHAPSELGGIVSKRWVENAIHDALLPKSNPRHIDAVVTAPICKESWSMAGYKWPGHTELFASRTKSKRHAMMFVSDKLRVVLATCHVPLMDIRNVLTIGRVHDAIDLAHEGCQQLGIKNPTIGVTGLNPHAGENGLLGDEEVRIIEPAIKVAKNNGLNVHGPFPADTLFSRAESFDVIVAMYHDQGLLPIKLLSPQQAVNWTLGIPIIRTSPDHGTAFDIANTDKANPDSILHAITLACQLSTTRRTLPC
jgi:4-phospho-D-threonate 3-dehydrogenase / 4-phospho-D-erythronate 3-dehydrogenase